MKRIIIALAAVMSLLLLGCSAKSSGYMADTAASSNTTTYSKGEEAYQDYGLTEAPAASAEPQQEAGTASPADMYGGRKIIRNYDISLTTDSFDEDMVLIDQRLAEYGGYAQNSYVEGKKPEAYGETGRTASLTLRVPAEQADAFLEGIKALGTVSYLHDYTDDITDAYYDVDTRLEILKIQLDRLKSILVKTDNLADVIALEERISEVMLEIEELTGTLKKYDALISYATVSVTLREKSLISGPAAEKTTGERISEGFTDTLYGVGTFFVDFFVWFVSALPVLVILAIIAVAVVLIVRRCRRRKANKKAAAAQNSPQKQDIPQNFYKPQD